MLKRSIKGSVVVLALLAVSACATGRAIRSAQDAAARADWDTAVAYYREALASDPGRIDVRVALERAMRIAAAEHMRRARDLEAQDQLAGAAAEYRIAADLEPGATLALSKAIELERKIREQIEATRPRPRIETLQQQAQRDSPIPRLDPRTRVPAMSFRQPGSAIRDILNSIRDFTGININYDQNLDQILNRAYTFEVQDMPLEEALNQILTANGLTFKVQNPRSILIYQDNVANRQKFEDMFVQPFYLSHIDAQEMLGIITQMTTSGPMVRPTVTVNKTANSVVVKATASVMAVIDSVIKANDKPRAEVLVDVEILEVDRSELREMGIDLSQWAIGLTFSPELAPPNTVAPAVQQFPTAPPPFNLNTISQGVSAADYYLSVPTMLIRALETASRTRLLARPQLRGREGSPLLLNLGTEVPVPATIFNQANFGQTGTIPTQVNYRPVGVNLSLNNVRVTYQDEIIMDLIIDRSGVGPPVLIAGQASPSFVSRKAQTSLRLRDGESNLLAGLIRDEEVQSTRGFPGLSTLPIFSWLFGTSTRTGEQTDIVMIVTPRIVRGHDLTSADLKAVPVGTFMNMQSGSVPTLISPDAPLPPPTAGAGGGAATPPPPGTPAGALPPTVPQPTVPPPTPATPPKTVGVVPIQPVGATPAAPAATGPAQITMTAPPTTLGTGSQPHLLPIQISGVQSVGTISITLTFDPAIVRPLQVMEGTFMTQGGGQATFAQKIDAQAGRVDITISRSDSTGASTIGSAGGLLASIIFQAGAAGQTSISASAMVTTVTGQAIPIQIGQAIVMVK